MPAPQILKTGEKTWENQHHTFIENIDNLSEMWNSEDDDILEGYNQMTASIQKEIAEMIKAKKTMRALGGGWSWTRIATNVQGAMYNTKNLNTRFTIDPSLVADYKGNPKDLLFVQCGTKIHELNSYLEGKNRALKTSGASNGQTIAGALSTGTHGSAFDFGAVPEFVVGLHIIVGPERQHSIWLERKSKPVASSDFAELINAVYLDDDEKFNAALVSFGSFGFIHGVMIETEPIYLLECYRKRVTDLAALYRLMETMDFANNSILPYPNDRPHHFQVTLNPYDMANGAYVTTMYKQKYGPYTPQNLVSDIGLGDDAPSFIGKLTDALPDVVPIIVNGVIKNQYPLFNKQFGTRGEVFGDTELVGKLYSAAIGIPLNEVNHVREILFDLNARKNPGPFTGVFAFRFVKASTATLGFTYFPPVTCVLELDGVFSKRIQNYYSEMWAALDKEKVTYTFHWGKLNELNPVRLLSAYQGRVDKWKEARKSLMDPDTLKVFDNSEISKWGLA